VVSGSATDACLVNCPVTRPTGRLLDERGTAAQTEEETDMQTFVIERGIDGIGDSTPGDLQAISQKSCGVLQQLGTDVQWVHSYVTDDKIYCVYRATDAELVREHARQGGFPADVVASVRSMIDPTSASSAVPEA
jgi:hypothetical protein